MPNIAIISYSGRFPGGADTPEALWEALAGGRDLVGKVPSSRWNSERHCHPGGKDGLDHTSDCGGFLDEIDQFDPAAFGISPREADTMDPGQRLLLEQSWRCWERAGLVPAAWAGRPVGVFVGAFTQDYLQLQISGGMSTVNTMHSATGTMQTLLSNRISYCYDLQGPSLTVDTACSSSLVALHLAIASIEKGESELALVGGIQLQLTPYHTAMESRGGFLSPQGRCFTFDARANGYVRAEAAAMVLLAPLERAEREGWPIEGVIHASAVNQNGKPAGVTLPSPEAQQRLIASALAQAGLTPDDLGYVEAHGTGTRAGDQAEALAIGEALGRQRKSGPLWIGSIKTNLGHAEAAAGITGLIKVLLCMRHRQIAPHLHWRQSPPGMDLEASGLRLPLSVQPWPLQAPYAAVNSFGFGGTNAHLIVGPGRALPPRQVLPPRREHALPLLLLLSGPSAAHLPLQAKAMEEFIAGLPDDADLAELSAASVHQRQQFSHTVGLVGADRAALLAGLADFHRLPGSQQWAQGERASAGTAGLAWVYAGMGPQWREMGCALSRAFPVFEDTYTRCARRFEVLAGYSLQDELDTIAPGNAALPAQLAQPMALCFQLALASLLRAHGIEPAAVVGHSIGEIAAFHAAGALDTDTALILVWQRSRLQAELAGQGGMMAMEGEDAAEMCQRHHLCIAARNSPTMVTVSGAHAGLDSLARELSDLGRYCKRLQVNLPYHSALMAPLESAFRAAVAGLRFRPAERILFSTVTGGRIDDTADFDFADYWWRNLREPVAFSDALAAMRPLGLTVFQEISAQPVLQTYLRTGLEGSAAVAMGTLHHGREESCAYLESLCRLHACGVSVGWSTLLARPAQRVAMPGMVWLRERFWSESTDNCALRLGRAEHPLLGYRRPDGSLSWDVDLHDRPEWRLVEHRVLGQARLPAAVYLEMLCAACSVAAPHAAPRLLNLRFHRGAVMESESSLRLSTELDVRDGSIRIYGAGRRLLAEARCATAWPTQDLESPPAPPTNPDLSWDGARFYAALRPLGYDYGPAFQCIASINISATACRAVINGKALPGLTFAPAVLDACLQSCLGLELVSGLPLSNRLPVGAGEIRLYRRPEDADFPLLAACRRVDSGDDTPASLGLYSRSGALLAELLDLKLMAPTPPSALNSRRKPADTLYRLDWKSISLSVPTASTRCHWMLWGRKGGAADALALALTREGDAVTICDPAVDGDTAKLFAIVRDGASGVMVDLQALDWHGEHPAGDLASNLGTLSRHWQSLAKLVNPRWQLWCVTRGACDPIRPCPRQAAVWGVARALSNVEFPQLFRGVVDLPSDASHWPKQLAELMRSPQRENQYRLYDTQWQIPQFQACGGAAPAQITWLNGQASYLITGGFGALGRLTARFLADHGARNLIVIASQPLPPRNCWTMEQPAHVRERIDWIVGLEADGIRVLPLGFDIARRENWAVLATSMIDSGFPPVRGLVHAAGVTADQPFIDVDGANIDAVLGPKVAGACHLFDALGDTRLDFALLYSSVSGLFPAYGQSMYAAANCFLDAYALALQARGVPARTLAWGPWTVGMAGSDTLARLFRSQGMLPIAPDEGYQILQHVFSTREPALYGVALDWAGFVDSHRRQLWLFGEAVLQIQADIRDGSATCAPARRPPGSTCETALADLVQAASEVMGLKAEDVIASSNLCQMGLDSLMAVEMQIKLGKQWDVELGLTDLLGRASLWQLAGRLSEKQLQPAPEQQEDNALAPAMVA